MKWGLCFSSSLLPTSWFPWNRACLWWLWYCYTYHCFVYYLYAPFFSFFAFPLNFLITIIRLNFLSILRMRIQEIYSMTFSYSKSLFQIPSSFCNLTLMIHFFYFSICPMREFFPVYSFLNDLRILHVCSLPIFTNARSHLVLSITTWTP